MRLYDANGNPLPDSSASSPDRLDIEEPRNKTTPSARGGLRTKPHTVAIAILLGLCTVVGGVASLIVFLPRILVSPPPSPLNANDIFSVSFEVTNAGFIPLRDATAALGLGQIIGKGSRLDRRIVPTFDSFMTMPQWQHHSLDMDQRFTVVLSDLLRADVTEADIAIIVFYRPWGLPLRRKAVFRFVAFPDSYGSSYWRSWPVGERLPQAMKPAK